METTASLTYTADDFLSGTAPFEEVYRCRANAFEHQRAIERMDKLARGLRVTGFKGMYKNYVKSLESSTRIQVLSSPTEFSAQPIQLDAGEWLADDSGVCRPCERGTEIACPHPLTVTERLVNIDTGEEKLTLAWRKGGFWRQQTFGKDILASSQRIVALASTGIAVTSETAKALVKYISDLENLNYDYIPEKKSVSRLGFIGEEGFAPYVDNLIFDGDSNYRPLYSTVKQVGSYEKWLAVANEVRSKSVTAKLLIAASFASPLIRLVGALPFFVHLWGDSGGGKTVALMVAAAVWADPELGHYLVTFNSTNVGLERVAAFLNNLPLCIDETQLLKSSTGKSTFDVYKLAQGVGKNRGTKTGGIEITPTWSNCILTTGEAPITSSSDGAGAMNRVVEIACSERDFAVETGSGPRISNIVKRNYGWAGYEFISRLYAEDILAIEKRYAELSEELSKNDTTEKQAMASAMIILGDELADRWIFKSGNPLTPADIGRFLQTKKAVSIGERGYAFICGWLSINSNHFKRGEEPVIGEIYGSIESGYAFIVKTKFTAVLESEGISSAALLRWLKDEGKLLTRGRNLSKGKRINGVLTECVCMRLPEDDSVNAINPDDFEEIL